MLDRISLELINYAALAFTLAVAGLLAHMTYRRYRHILPANCPECHGAGQVFDRDADKALRCVSCDGRGWLNTPERHDFGSISQAWRKGELSGRDLENRHR